MCRRVDAGSPGAHPPLCSVTSISLCRQNAGLSASPALNTKTFAAATLSEHPAAHWHHDTPDLFHFRAPSRIDVLPFRVAAAPRNEHTSPCDASDPRGPRMLPSLATIAHNACGAPRATPSNHCPRRIGTRSGHPSRSGGPEALAYCSRADAITGPHGAPPACFNCSFGAKPSHARRTPVTRLRGHHVRVCQTMPLLVTIPITVKWAVIVNADTCAN